MSIEVGIYKNYKELCKALNWKVTGGTAKEAQFRTLDTLCKWHKEGIKIVVTEVYAEPKEKIDNRVNNGGNSTSKYNVDDHFAVQRKMIKLAKGATRNVIDYKLSKYACYLVVMNGNPKKEIIALAQTYFTIQTRNLV